MDNGKEFREYQSDFELRDLWNLIKEYAILIFFITFIFFAFISIKVYFQPSKYSSYSIIEVKTASSNNKEITNTNDLLQKVFHSNYKNINREIEILKTFKMNKEIIKKINFKVQFFVEKNYFKKVEIYGSDVPIEIRDIIIYNKNILGKKIKVSLKEDGYYLSIDNSSELIKKLLKKDELVLNSNKLYPYGKIIKTEYFHLSIDRKNKNYSTLYFKINGKTRNIYENMIKPNLIVEQLNKDTPLIKISYEDNIPKRTADYVNQLVNIFIEEEKRYKNKNANDTLKFIEEQLKSVKAKLDSAERRLEDYKVKNNIINLSSQSNSIIKKLSDLEIEISENKITNVLIKNALSAIENEQDFESIMAILTKLKNDGIILALRTLNQLKLKELELSKEYTDRYPELIDVRNEMDRLKMNLIQNIKNLEFSIKHKILTLKKEKSKYEKKLLLFPKKEIVQINLKSKYDINAQLYMYLLKKREESKMINRALSNSSDYEIIEKAYIPISSSKEKEGIMKIIASSFIGFIVGVILAIAINKAKNKISNIRELNKGKKWFLTSEIPVSQDTKKSNIYNIDVFENSESEFAESFRKLRTDLEFSLGLNKKSNVILITSTIPEEQKSSVVVNLGAIFQLTKFKKSILVDLDLRNPTICNYFDIEGCKIGISSYLSGREKDLNKIIFKTDRLYLDIISSGNIPKNPSELLLSKKLDNLFSVLSERYDYVIVNAPPTSVSLSDMVVLTKYSDINLFVFRSGVSKKHFIKKIEKIIDKYNLKMFGAILTNSKKKEDDEI